MQLTSSRAALGLIPKHSVRSRPAASARGVHRHRRVCVSAQLAADEGDIREAWPNCRTAVGQKLQRVLMQTPAAFEDAVTGAPWY